MIIGIFFGLIGTLTTLSSILFIINNIFALNLDFGQRIIFTILLAILLGIITIIFASNDKENEEYLLVGVPIASSVLGYFILFIFLVAHYGFHAEFVGNYFSWLFK